MVGCVWTSRPDRVQLRRVRPQPGSVRSRVARQPLESLGCYDLYLRDARLPAVLCAAGYYFWRRGILGTIVVGMVVYLPLHIGWNW